MNVASKCGLTPQYEGLEKLHEQYADQGFSVLGVPCNQFGGQEPGSSEEIATFCSTTYGVTFPLAEKVDVNGDDRHPLYAELTAGGRRRGPRRRHPVELREVPGRPRRPGHPVRPAWSRPRTTALVSAVEAALPALSAMRGRTEPRRYPCPEHHERHRQPPPRPPSEAPLTFEALGVSPRLVKALADQGITEPFAIQRLSIADALAGRDVCGKAKTGSGKTLAFGLPAPRAARPRPSLASRAASCWCPPASSPSRCTTCSPRWPRPSAAGWSPSTAAPT